MFVKRILLKKIDGSEQIAMKLFLGDGVIVPDKGDLQALSARIDKGSHLAIRDRNQAVFPSSASLSSAITLFGKRGQDRFFGSTDPREDSPFVLWELSELAARAEANEEAATVEPQESKQKESPRPERERDKTDEARKEDSERPPSAEAEDSARPSQSEDLSVRFGIDELGKSASESKEGSPLRLMEKGEPFPLLENVMIGSRWVKIRDENAYYLGILQEKDKTKWFYGIEGNRETAPEGNFAFYPFPEKEDVGIFVSEGEDVIDLEKGKGS